MFTLILWHTTTFGQAQKAKEIFPSYDQIKPSKDYIVDYGGPNSIIKVEKKTINLFDYPTGTVTYILNGNSSTDVNYVKQVLSEKGKDIDSISVGKLDQKGKRVIKINYNIL